ncbi:MAG: carboxypeptidase-like regulatory domain-containing protein [Acidobacteriota bacterium]
MPRPLPIGFALVFALLLGADTWADIQGSSPLPVMLQASAADGAALGPGRFLLQSLSDDAAPSATVAWTATPGESRSQTQLELPHRSRWRVCIEVDGQWAPCRELTVTKGATLDFRTWPTNAIQGTFRATDPARAPPEQLTLHFAPAAASGQAPFARSSVSCDVDGLRWRCHVPALALDLELRPQGFVPIYRFGIDVPATGDFVLGSLDLQRGASLVARVEAEDGAMLSDRGRGRLVPFVPGQRQRNLADRLSRSVAEATIQGDGFLQLAALPAGVYALEVTHPGFAPTIEYPIELWPETEVRWRDPVVLNRPLDLAVEISPSSDWRGHPWRLQLSRVSELTGADTEAMVFDGLVDESGSVRIAGQAAGRYSLQVFDSAGNPLYGELDRRVSGAADAKIAIALDLVMVRGQVRYRDEPVLGKVWFGGRHGAVRSAMATSAEGDFLGVLSHPGWWTIDVEVPVLGSSRLRSRVLVEPDSSGDAEVVVELPDTELAGRVVDPAGQPIGDADVLLLTAAGSLRSRTDADGKFSFRAFEGGTVTLLARSVQGETERVSNSLDLEVSEGMQAGPFDLVLETVETFAGKIVSEGGPVAGAMVELISIDPAIAAYSEARTDIEGRFEVRLRPEIDHLRIIVSPPGHALKGVEVPLRRPLHLRIPTAGGTLAIRWTGEDSHAAKSPSRLQVEQDGIALSPHLLWAWARGHGGRGNPRAGLVTIPRLAPGFYRVCELTVELSDDRGSSSPNCAGGYLDAGGSLELELASSGVE